MKVLVIDDDPNIAQAILLAFGLQWQAVEVKIVYDGLMQNQAAFSGIGRCSSKAQR